VRVYKLKVFARFQRGEGMRDKALCRAVRDAEAGLIDADLGGGLIKQRVARPGQGKRGGYRTIIAYRARERSVFLFGFAKSARADLKPDEQADLARIGARWLKASEQEIEAAIANVELKEVDCGEEDESER
jgi:hypothetical protein